MMKTFAIISKEKRRPSLATIRALNRIIDIYRTSL